MKIFKLIFFSLIAFLVACGGGGGDPGSGSGSSGGVVSSLEVLTSEQTLSPTNSAGVIITVIAKDIANNALAGQPISFSASSGVLGGASAATGDDGKATAVLTAGLDKSNRDVTVTVKSGNATGTVVVAVSQDVPSVSLVEVAASATSLRTADVDGIIITAVVKDGSNNVRIGDSVTFSASSGVLSNVSAQTGPDGRATATLLAGSNRTNRSITVTVTAGSNVGTIVVPVEGSTLSVAGATSLLAGGAATFTVNLKDSSGNGIGAQPIAVTSALGNAVTLARSSTDSAGATTFSYVASRSGEDIISVTAGGIVQNYTVNITSVNFAFISPASGTDAAVNVATPVTVRYVENGVAVVGKPVSFATTRGSASPAMVTTDALGYATTQITSSSAGPASVSAQLDSAITSLPIYFVAKIPHTINLQASSAALAPNTSATMNNQVELRATVRDAAGNAVKGVTVNFSAIKDLSGGRIKTGNAVTDANGIATDSFIAGGVSTAANGVEIQAAVANTVISSTALLTVSGQSLFINIAANNVIEKLATTYRKTFSVQVNDANGAPVAGQNVTLSYYPPNYRKGRMGYKLIAGMWVVVESTQCVNEDINRDGQLSGGEDFNGNGRLTPGLPGLIAPSFVTTNNAGSAEFTMEYGQQYAFWVDFDISAKVVVAGTESGTTFFFPASALADDLTDSAVTPAAYISPFGVIPDCRSST